MRIKNLAHTVYIPVSNQCYNVSANTPSLTRQVVAEAIVPLGLVQMLTPIKEVGND